MELDVFCTNSNNIDFKELISQLDIELNNRYGELQKQYNKHNKIELINDVIIIYSDLLPVACGAFKEYDNDSIELKRIFVLDKFRGKGLAKLIVNELERMARGRNYKYSFLETGKRQPEAIGLYKKCGYKIIPNYGPYIDNFNSICMKKFL